MVSHEVNHGLGHGVCLGVGLCVSWGVKNHSVVLNSKWSLTYFLTTDNMHTYGQT